MNSNELNNYINSLNEFGNDELKVKLENFYLFNKPVITFFIGIDSQFKTLLTASYIDETILNNILDSSNKLLQTLTATKRELLFFDEITLSEKLKSKILHNVEYIQNSMVCNEVESVVAKFNILLNDNEKILIDEAEEVKRVEKEKMDAINRKEKEEKRKEELKLAEFEFKKLEEIRKQKEEEERKRQEELNQKLEKQQIFEAIQKKEEERRQQENQRLAEFEKQKQKDIIEALIPQINSFLKKAVINESGTINSGKYEQKTEKKLGYKNLTFDNRYCKMTFEKFESNKGIIDEDTYKWNCNFIFDNYITIYINLEEDVEEVNDFPWVSVKLYGKTTVNLMYKEIVNEKVTKEEKEKGEEICTKFIFSSKTDAKIMANYLKDLIAICKKVKL